MAERTITKEDIEFLKALQNEMLTQDNVGQADPRFWVIKQTERVYRVEEGDGVVYVIDSDYENEFEELDDVKKYLIENELCTAEELDDVVDDNDLEVLFDEKGIEFERIAYRDEQVIKEDTFFLTLREAQEHIERNYYHYNKSAHPYAMTAWRSPQVEKLYEILQKVDFDKIGVYRAEPRVPLLIHDTLICSNCFENQITETKALKGWEKFCPTCGHALKQN
jgi:hypothetical protein